MAVSLCGDIHEEISSCERFFPSTLTEDTCWRVSNHARKLLKPPGGEPSHVTSRGPTLHFWLVCDFCFQLGWIKFSSI